MKNGIFSGLDRVRVGVLGDFCVDIYWYADMKRSTLSRETPLFPYPILRERVSPGAAGNVAANLAALRPASVRVCSVIGDDWRGGLLRESLGALGIDTSGLIAEAGRMTNAYCKPILSGISDTVYEASRLDFENSASPAPPSEGKVLAWLRENVPTLDVLCVCDQFTAGTVTDAVRDAILAAAKDGLTVICDSRDRAASFSGVILKPNEVECLRAVGRDPIGASETEILDAAAVLAAQTGSRILVTMGARGSAFVAPDEIICRVSAVPTEPPLDICGAGDTFLSAFSAMLGSGNAPETSMKVASCASAVTVKKLGMTGVATREEIGEIFEKINP